MHEKLAILMAIALMFHACKCRSLGLLYVAKTPSIAIPVAQACTVVVATSASVPTASKHRHNRNTIILADEMPPIGGFILAETLVLAGVSFRRRCHLRRRCQPVLGFLQR